MGREDVVLDKKLLGVEVDKLSQDMDTSQLYLAVPWLGLDKKHANMMFVA